MKKIFITLAVILGFLLILLLLLPVFLKSNIVDILKAQSAKYIYAELDIKEVNLSMFKDFPDLNVKVKDIVITGKDEFAGDTVVALPWFEASVNLMSLMKGNEILINRILLKDMKFLPVKSPEGKANWDFFIRDTTGSAAAPTEKTDSKSDAEKGIRFNDIELQNLFVSYKDYQSSVYAGINRADLKVSGNFAETNTLLNILLQLDNISYRQGNQIWVNNTDLNWQAEIGANLKERSFDIRKNELALNELQLDLTGQFTVLPEKYRVDLSLKAPGTKFEDLLSLVPKHYQKEIQGLKTTGDFTLSASAQGEYYKDHLPALDIQFQINDASVQYPDLPEAIRNINLALQINNPGGSPELTQINLNRMAFTIAGNPFQMHLKIVNPQDPSLNGGAKGVIDFGSLKKALPLKDVTLKGMITTDVTFNGKYQYIEKEMYEKFTAKGSIQMKDILLQNAGFPKGISIPSGSLVITPAYLNLNHLEAKINSSDFTLKGKVSNYLPYFLKNEILKGYFTLVSQRLNLNEFANMSSSSAPDSLEAGNAVEGALEVPRNIDLQLDTRINTLIFDRLLIQNIQGKVNLSKAVATLKNLRMDLLNGTMVMNGNYNTVDPRIPTFDFNLNISDFDIHSLYNSFTFIRKSLPIAMNCNGRISSALQFSAQLDKKMDILMHTANGAGYLESKGILINENPAMSKLASVVKNDELSRLSISSLKINFNIQEGNITVEPFKTTFAGNPVTIYGSQTVDGRLDYTLSMKIDRKFFGKDINNLLKPIPGSGNIKSLDIDAKIVGTLAKPEVKADLSKAIKAVQKEAQKELKNKAVEGLKKLFR